MSSRKVGLGLPHGWCWATVGDTGRYINGFAFKPGHRETAGRPIVRIQNLTDSEKPLNRTSLTVPEDFHVATGEMLLSWSATVDVFLWNREPALVNQHIFRVVPDEGVVDKTFLFHWLKVAIDQLLESEHLHGSTMKHINRGPFMAHQIPLPPLREQQRIAETLEELLSDLDAGVAELKAAQRKLAQYRQSLLKAAVEGALTADWRARRRTTSPQPNPYQGVGATAADESRSAHDEAKMPTPARPYAPASAHLHAPAPAHMQSSLPRTASGNAAPLSPRGRGAGGEGANDGNTPSPALLRQRARDMRHEPTPQEHQLWQQLRAKRFASYKFRRQQPIGRYIVDFVCFAERLIVELDGGQHADAAAYDAQRDAWLQAQGFRVLRFWNNEWTEHTDAVLDAIWTALAFSDTGAAAPPPLPNPSPARGEGLESETGAELLQRILRERRARWEQKQLAKFAEQGKAPPKGWQDKYPEPVAPDLTDLPSLPEGWVWATVEQLAELVSGHTPKDAGQFCNNDGLIHWFKVGDMNSPGNETCLATASMRFSENVASDLGLKVAPAGTIVFPKRGGAIATNKKRRLGIAAAYDLNMMGLIATPSSAEWLWSWFKGIDLAKLSDGSNIPQINNPDIAPLLLPIPPAPELEELIERLETSLQSAIQQEEAITKVMKQIEAQRKNILKAAFSGQLVPQDPNDEPASALLARIRAQREANAGTSARKRGRKAGGAA